MSKVKQVLRLHAQGVSNRRIAKDLGLYKGTVNNYVDKIRNHRYDIDELLALDDPELEGKLFTGNPAYKESRFEEFKNKIPHFEKELGRKHVTRYLLWQEYRQEHPDGYGYSQFCFHLGQLRCPPSAPMTFSTRSPAVCTIWAGLPKSLSPIT